MIVNHQFEQTDAGYRCAVCWKTRKTKPDAYDTLGCPGLPVYPWQGAPAHLMTRKQLRAEKLKPGGPVRAYLPGKDMLYELFDKGEAMAVKPATEAQLAALAKARERQGKRKCPICREWVSRYSIERNGICYNCNEKAKWEEIEEMDNTDRNEAIHWARECLTLERCVILDTETTGLHSAEVIQISVIDMQGKVLLDSLIKPIRPIPADATMIHGITDAMVENAPAWPVVFPHLVAALNDRIVITYNAEFDYAMIADSCIYNKLLTDDLPDGWRCAMLMYASFFGEWNDYHKNWKWQRLPGGDHSALGDCQATLSLIREMAAARLSKEEGRG